jgi:hypothetical protein
MNFLYDFIVPGPILRHLGEFGKIRLLLGENTRFLPEGGPILAPQSIIYGQLQVFMLILYEMLKIA